MELHFVTDRIFSVDSRDPKKKYARVDIAQHRESKRARKSRMQKDRRAKKISELIPIESERVKRR